MKRDFKILLWSLLLAMVAISCESDNTEDVGSYDTSDQISVSLMLNVDDMEAGTEEAATRSSIAASDNDGISSEVNNLWVAQCNGTADESKVLVACHITDMTTDALTLIKTNNTSTMVYLANVDNSVSITVGMTLAEIKALSPTLSAPASAEQLYTTGLVNEFDGTKYFVMSGMQTIEKIEKDTKLTASLKRNAVKVTINLLNQWHDSTIKGVMLKSVAGTTGYLLNRADLDAKYPAIGDDYTAINYPETALDIAGDIFADDSDIESFNFYIPANMRGTNSSSTDETTKPTYAPDYATYLVIRAEDGFDFFYNYYLGADLVSDYNLKPNYHYTYDVTFTGVGDVGGDDRIKGTVEVDYSELSSSNCYIINSMKNFGYIYYIPIEERINTFWSEYATTHITPFSGNTTTDDWSFDVLWYDNDADPIATSSTNLDNQIYIEKVERNGKQCLKVTAPYDFDNWGNILVAVKKSGSDDILWSWHLWVTDYNPYSPIGEEVDEGSYGSSLAVTGGDLHRYTDAKNYKTWSNTYAGKYIMDRYLGARDTDYSTESTLYYQFGRKDPIPFVDGIVPNVAGPKTIAESVLDPTYFITSSTSGNWCSEYDDTTYIWNDKNVTSVSGKSIFDPSPYGFCVPTSDIWSYFNEKNADGNYYNYSSLWTYGDFINYPREFFINAKEANIETALTTRQKIKHHTSIV